jgi:hypothetical protein
MRKLIVVALLLLFCADASAQFGKVLIVSSTESRAQRLTAAIDARYDGILVTLPTLPPDLPFDAVFVQTQGWSQDPLLDSISQIRLIEYLKDGGRFYAEGDAFRSTKDGASNPLWDYLGDSAEYYASIVVDLTRIRGIDSEFTAAMDFADDPFESMGDAGAQFIVEKMRPLLLGDGPYIMPLAWAPSDRSVKAVLNWPIGGAQYDEFLARVICAHFQLCLLDVAEQPTFQRHIAFDPILRELRLPAAGSVSFADLIGRRVFVGLASSDRFSIPKLAPGSYIVNWHNDEETANTTIIVR